MHQNCFIKADGKKKVLKTPHILLLLHPMAIQITARLPNVCRKGDIYFHNQCIQVIKISYHHKPNYLFSVTLGISPSWSYLWSEYCKYTKYYTRYQNHVVSGYLEVVAIIQWKADLNRQFSLIWWLHVCGQWQVCVSCKGCSRYLSHPSHKCMSSICLITD